MIQQLCAGGCKNCWRVIWNYWICCSKFWKGAGIFTHTHYILHVYVFFPDLPGHRWLVVFKLRNVQLRLLKQCGTQYRVRMPCLTFSIPMEFFFRPMMHWKLQLLPSVFVNLGLHMLDEWICWRNNVTISPKPMHPLPCRVALTSKEGYTQLASLAYAEGLKLYKLRPKVHMLYEIALQLTPDEDGGDVLSPVATCCWSDEDYIGRVSRVARSCHGATQSIGAMRKTLGMYRLQFTRCRQATSKAAISRWEELHWGLWKG